MRNATAQISESGYGKAIERFADDDEVKESIVRRETLPIAIAERLVSLVSDNLQTYLVRTMGAGEHRRRYRAANPGCHHDQPERGLQRSRAGAPRPTCIGNGRLTPFLVLRALCMGDMAFFEVAMAVVAHIPRRERQAAHSGCRPYGLRSLFDQIPLAAALFPAFRVAVDVALDAGLDAAERDPERYRVQVINRVLAKFEQLGEREHDFLLNKLIGVLTFVARAKFLPRAGRRLIPAGGAGPEGRSGGQIARCPGRRTAKPWWDATGCLC